MATPPHIMLIAEPYDLSGARAVCLNKSKTTPDPTSDHYQAQQTNHPSKDKSTHIRSSVYQ